MIITIHGQAGSGKSSISKLLARRLKYRRYSVGDMRRQIAKKRGLTLAQLNKLGETQDWTDREPDKLQKELGKKQDDFVIDGRTCFHFIPHSFKVYLHADLNTRAERVFLEKRRFEKFRSLKETEKALVEREKSDRLRYRKYYRIDITDMKNYDLVIDTTKLSKKQIIERILEALKPKPGKIRE